MSQLSPAPKKQRIYGKITTALTTLMTTVRLECGANKLIPFMTDVGSNARVLIITITKPVALQRSSVEREQTPDSSNFGQ